MLREFKPVQPAQRKVTREEVGVLFAKGEFKQAYRFCRENGWSLSEFSSSLTKMGRLMFHSRPGELASLVFKYRVDVGYTITSILKAQFARKDYHGFLKHVHQFNLFEDLKPEVHQAIGQLKREEEAQSWRKKFAIRQ